MEDNGGVGLSLFCRAYIIVLLRRHPLTIACLNERTAKTQRKFENRNCRCRSSARRSSTPPRRSRSARRSSSSTSRGSARRTSSSSFGQRSTARHRRRRRAAAGATVRRRRSTVRSAVHRRRLMKRRSMQPTCAWWRRWRAAQTPALRDRRRASRRHRARSRVVGTVTRRPCAQQQPHSTRACSVVAPKDGSCATGKVAAVSGF